MKCKFLLVLPLLVATAFSFSPLKAQQKNESQKTELKGSLNSTTYKSDNSGETYIDYLEDGHRYKIKLNGSKIVEMYLDEKKVAEEDYHKYDSMVKKIVAQIEKDREQAEKDRAQAEKDRAQAERDREQARKDRAQAEKDRQQAERDREQARLDREQAEKDRAQAEVHRKLLDAMIEELVTEKIVESRNALTSLELDDTKLIINGKEQPASIHSRLKEKYLKGKSNRISYRNSGGSLNVSFN